MQHNNYFLSFSILLFFTGLSKVSAQWLPSPAPAGEDIEQIFFVNQQVGYVAAHSYIFKTADGGQTWSEVYHPGQINGSEIYYFRSMFFTSATTGYVVGQDFWQADHLVLRTQNGGQSWTPTTVDAGFNVGEAIDVDFANAFAGFVSTNQGRILKTSNGGDTWTVASISGANGAALSALDFPDTQNGYVLPEGGDNLYKTTNGGSSWQTINLPTKFYKLKFFNYQTGVAGGLDGLYKTTDAGLTWTLISEKLANGIQVMQFLDENTGFAFTADGLCKTVNGGKTWHVQQVDTGWPASVNQGLTCLSAADGQTAWCGGYRDSNGNLVSMMVKTANGGGLGVHLGLSKNLFDCPGDSVIATPSFLGTPVNVAWYVKDTLFSTVNATRTIPLPASGNIPVRLEASSGNVKVSMTKNVQVNGIFGYPGVTFTIPFQKCQGEITQVNTNWNTGWGKLVLYQGATFIDTIKILISPSSGKYFELPPVYANTEFTIKVVNFTCHLDVTLGSVTVIPKPLPSVDFTLSTAQPVYCSALQTLQVIQSGSEPNIAYRLYKDGVSEDSENGTGGPLTYKIISTLDKPVHLWFRAFSQSTQCLAYSDTILLPIDITDATFSMSGVNLMEGTPLEVKFRGILASQYDWSFGDQADPPASNLLDPGPIQYNGAVNTAVQLISTGPYGCRDTFVRDISVRDLNDAAPYWAMEMQPYIYGTANTLCVDKEGSFLINAKSNFPKNYYMPSKQGAGVTIFPEQSILKYNRYGILLWQIQHGGEYLNVQRLLFDQDGNIVGMYEAEGFSSGSILTLSSTTKDPIRVYNEEKAVIAKWDPDGNILWKAEVKTCDIGGVLPADIAIDDENNIYVLFNDHDVPVGCGNKIDFMSADSSVVQRIHPGETVVKFSPEGKYLFSFDAKVPNQTGLNARKLGLDADRNFYIGGSTNTWLSKFSPTGAWIWTVAPQSNTPAPQCTAQNMITDPTGNTYLIGDFRNTVKFGTKVIASSAPDPDAYVAKVDSSGQVQWIKSMLADKSIQTKPLALWNDRVYVGADFQHLLHYPPVYLTMNYQLSGDLGALWMELSAQNGGVISYQALIESNPSIAYNTPYSNHYHDIGTDADGNIYLGGINGYHAEWADTLLQSRVNLFLTRIAGFSKTIGTKEALAEMQDFEAVLSPNPGHAGLSSLVLKFPESGQIRAVLTDLQGRRQLLFDRELPEGTTEYFLETPPPGVYMLHLQGEHGAQKVLKWLVE